MWAQRCTDLSCQVFGAVRLLPDASANETGSKAKRAALSGGALAEEN
jgi:hypothetical protein